MLRKGCWQKTLRQCLRKVHKAFSCETDSAFNLGMGKMWLNLSAGREECVMCCTFQIAKTYSTLK